MDINDDSCSLGCPPPQQSRTAKKTARMPTSSSAQPNATAIGIGSLNKPTQQLHHDLEDGIDPEQTSTRAELPASSNPIVLPFRDGPSVANTKTQSSQTGGISNSSAYLSARKLLVKARNSKPHVDPTESVVDNAIPVHTHFAEPLTRLMSEISAEGHDALLPEVMLLGLAQLVSSIEKSCSAASKATHSTTESAAAGRETIALTFRSLPAKPSASSVLASTATSTTKNAVHVSTAFAASPRTMTLAFCSHPIRSSAPSAPASTPPTAQPFRILSLLDGVKARTLSFLPDETAALSCRLVYRELRGFVDMFEPQIAALTAVSGCIRLRSQIGTRREMVPSSLADFVRKAALWVKLRGLCPEEPSITIDSFTAWRLTDSAHRDMMKRGVEVEPHDLVTWGTLTTFLPRL